jgi:hypothetical protein
MSCEVADLSHWRDRPAGLRLSAWHISLPPPAPGCLSFAAIGLVVGTIAGGHGARGVAPALGDGLVLLAWFAGAALVAVAVSRRLTLRTA